MFLSILLLLLFNPVPLEAHPSPNTLVFVDVQPGKVLLEVQMPVPELELAFGHNLSRNPENIINQWGPELTAYLLQHIHAYVSRNHPWQVKVNGLKMAKGLYADQVNHYWEVNADVELIPSNHESTRKFFLDYSVIMHQVINHVAFVAIRSDWETGNVHDTNSEPQIISWNNRDNVIDPLEISLQTGNWWKGFKRMMEIGMEHIKDGTDHLLFLIVLLLPAPLLTAGKRWGKFGGISYSLLRLVRIVTAFTIGHSITLLIGSLGWIQGPSQLVEILIAFSIFLSAIHAARPLFPGRETWIAGGFGLIHGLAFAGTLANLRLDTWPMVLSILGFNLGIELMQLMIIAIVMPWLLLISKTPFYHWFRLTGAFLAGIAALGWLVERLTTQENVITISIAKLSEYEYWFIGSLAILSVSLFIYYEYTVNKQKVKSRF
ncbi:MAG: HupE/UreJ family protein [Siphonobacter sp.]